MFSTEEEARATLNLWKQEHPAQPPRRLEIGAVPIMGLPMPELPGIYFLDLGGGVIKIGRASNIRARAAVAQTHCVATVKLLAWFPGAHREEAEIHRLLQPWLIRGELYRMEGEVLSKILQARNTAKRIAPPADKVAISLAEAVLGAATVEDVETG